MFYDVSRCFRLIGLLFLVGPASVSAEVVPLEAAHAHNDYYHQRPLLDALDQGFCSVEADVFLVDGKLLVAHSRNEIDSSKTLQSLYLDPLLVRVQENDGRVYRRGPEFTLLIDFKSVGTATFRALREQLKPYHEMLTFFHDGTVTNRAVKIVISGNRPIDFIGNLDPRYVFVDGRLTDLETDPLPLLMPLISDRWTSHFRWRGKGQMTVAEQEKLNAIVKRCHDRQQRIRFWATPDSPAVWGRLHDAGVDLINTDNLPGLAEFLQDKTR